ncbi:MAG: energy-coupling factor ABC transporter ATP-binding protein [Pigmentiphaga sp.]|nr:energy-coupling factor ABC transporter ATP-binding protein [Pigmentiphaga sp.]
MLIELDGVGVEREGRPVLAGLDLSLTERRIGIVGANGSGKSTLLRLFNGLAIPSAGRLRVDGLDPVTQARQVRRRVGFVFQNPDLQIVMPLVSEDLAFGLRNLGAPRQDVGPRIDAVLRQLGIEALASRHCHALSGGEKQLVALAAVLVMEPAILVFDEPTTLLDLRHRLRLGRCLAELPQAAIVASHDLDWLAGFDRILVLEAGRVVLDDAPAVALPWYRRRQEA